MALDQYNVQPKTDYVLNALVSVEGPILNGVKINRLLNMYQETFKILQDDGRNLIQDDNGNPVLETPPGYLAGQIYLFCAWVQILETIAYAVYTQTDLQTAIGTTLDRWGDLLGLKRSGLDDEPYRDALFLAIIEYCSKGEAETLIKIFKTITKSTAVSLEEIFPAKIRLTTIGALVSFAPADIQRTIQRTKAGGVGFMMVIGGPNPFGFQGNPLAQPFGAADISGNNLLIGGQFCGQAA